MHHGGQRMKRVLAWPWLAWLWLAWLGCAVIVVACNEERAATGPGGPLAVAVSSTAAQGGNGGIPVQGGAPEGGGGGADACDMMQDDGCYTCCAQDNRAGEAALRSAFMACGCPVCADAITGLPCGSSVCGGTGDPDYPCSACVKSAIGPTGPCFEDAGFQSGCMDNPDCAAFVACFHDCAP